MKRALIITYYWPPTGGSGVQRWVKFSKYLPQFGWQPVIYTPENPEQLAVDESLLSDIPSCAEVIKTHITEPYDIYRKLFGRQKKEVNPINSQKKSFKQKVSVWIRGNCFIPDPRIGWVKPSVKFLKKYLAEHPVDVVITTGPPQSMHLIGLGLKRALGVKWIADFRDPWTEMFYFKHLGLTKASERRHRRLEKSVLDEADTIISVTPLVQKDFQKKTDTPVAMITNGFDPSDFPARRNESDGRFRIVHTGLFASDGNPLLLWDVLVEMCSADASFREALQIRLAGKVDEEILQALRERGLEGNLVCLGYLEHEQTVLEQQNASVLILPLRQEPEYAKVLPGKIFEYLAARRPVLGIGQEDGAAAAVLADAQAGAMFGWDRKDELKGFISEVRSGGRECSDGNIDKYSRETLTKALTEIL